MTMATITALCIICLHQQNEENVIQLQCKHKICNTCFNQDIATQIEQNKNAMYKCPHCRQQYTIDAEMIHQYNIPIQCFTATTAVLIEHVQKFLAEGKYTSSDDNAKILFNNFERAVIQNNEALSIFWATRPSLLKYFHVSIVRNSLYNHKVSPFIAVIITAMATTLDKFKTQTVVTQWLTQHIKTTEDFYRCEEKIYAISSVFKSMHKHHIANILSSFSCNNILQGLKWWKQHHFKIAFNEDVYTTCNLQILIWWQKMDASFVKSLTAHSLVKVTDTKVLQWWKKNGQPFKYHQQVISCAVEKQAMDTLKWWYEANVPLSLDSNLFIEACQTGNAKIFKWIDKTWGNETCSMKHVAYPLFTLILQGNKNIQMFEYILGKMASEPDHIPFQFILVNIMNIGSLDMIKLLFKIPEAKQYAKENILELIFNNGHLHILRWWVDNGLPLACTEVAVDVAMSNNHFALVEWWIDRMKKENVNIKYSAEMFNCKLSKQKKIIDWIESQQYTSKLNKAIQEEIVYIKSVLNNEKG